MAAALMQRPRGSRWRQVGLAGGGALVGLVGASLLRAVVDSALLRFGSTSAAVAALVLVGRPRLDPFRAALTGVLTASAASDAAVLLRGVPEAGPDEEEATA